LVLLIAVWSYCVKFKFSSFIILFVGLQVSLVFTSNESEVNDLKDQGDVHLDLHEHLAISSQLKSDGRLHGGNVIGSSCQFSWLGDDGDNPSPEDYLKAQREEKARKDLVDKNRKIRADRVRAESRRVSLGRSQGDTPTANVLSRDSGWGCTVS
jgi:hypothetical protein